MSFQRCNSILLYFQCLILFIMLFLPSANTVGFGISGWRLAGAGLALAWCLAGAWLALAWCLAGTCSPSICGFSIIRWYAKSLFSTCSPSILACRLIGWGLKFLSDTSSPSNFRLQPTPMVREKACLALAYIHLRFQHNPMVRES